MGEDRLDLTSELAGKLYHIQWNCNQGDRAEDRLPHRMPTAAVKLVLTCAGVASQPALPQVLLQAGGRGHDLPAVHGHGPQVAGPLGLGYHGAHQLYRTCRQARPLTSQLAGMLKA